MKTMPLPTAPPPLENTPTPVSAASLIDTSKMSEGQRVALETAEAAREDTRGLGFAASLFTGRPDWPQLTPFPLPSAEDEDQGNAFLERLEDFLRGVDPDAIDRDGEIPDDVIEGLARLGAFGLKIPARFGGLGLSQVNYSRVAMRLGAFCGNLTALLSAHQSIGVPQPLMMFGTEEQKARWLPRCARGEITAFALTEPDVGSDPARLSTTATPIEDGKYFLINGEKLWCTNGTKAGLFVVMARTPAQPGQRGTPITAFVVEADTPGLEVMTRCRFMGLKALYNGVLRFTNVKVPREAILLGEGKGLRVALSTLNIGRITLPAACAGMLRWCVDSAHRWAAEREQWGAPIGHHAAIADKLARMSAHAFALESLVLYVSALVDQKKDVRLEAALAKLWGTERAWEAIDATMQIRGGRGYETAASQRARGEPAVPVERFFRDARINTIFEGSSEIMKLFIAREALDPHLRAGAPVLDSRQPWLARLAAAGRALTFYARLVPKMLLPWNPLDRPGMHDDGTFSREVRLVNRLSRRLARALLLALARFGPKLEREQLVLGRLVDAAGDILALAAAVARAQALPGRASSSPEDTALRDATIRHLAVLTEENVNARLRHLFRRSDRSGYTLTRRKLAQLKTATSSSAAYTNP